MRNKFEKLWNDLWVPRNIKTTFKYFVIKFVLMVALVCALCYFANRELWFGVCALAPLFLACYCDVMRLGLRSNRE